MPAETSADITYRTWQEGDDELFKPLLDVTGFFSERRYRAKFEDPGVVPEGVLLALHGAEPAGHIVCYHRRFVMGEREARIGGFGMVYVDERLRGRRIGKTLIQQAIEYHRAAGNRAATLFTHRTLKPAYAIYREFGFDDVIEREVYARKSASTDHRAALAVRPFVPDDRDRVANLTMAYAALQSGYTREFLAEFPQPELDPELRIVEHGGRVVGCYRIYAPGESARILNLAFNEAASAGEMLQTALADVASAGYRTVEIRVNNRHLLVPSLASAGFVKGDKTEAVLMMMPLDDSGGHDPEATLTDQIYSRDAFLEMECCALW